MAIRLNSSEKNFDQKFAQLLRNNRENLNNVHPVVSDILQNVKSCGDEQLFAFTKKFDHLDLTPETIRFSQQEIKTATENTDDEVRRALEFAYSRIKSHHQKQKPQTDIYTDPLGVKLGVRWTPLDAVGIYVPGGLASYPSSVLMNAIPAKVAGVNRIAMVVPTPHGKFNPAILAAAQLVGISEIYRVGGAQAIAALAFGTDSIAPVDKIVGPGNAYVAAAKQLVFGDVGIDTIAGPSEILVIADASANPAWVAADLLAQAEHGAGARAIAIVTDAAIASALEKEVERQLSTLSRQTIAAQGWNDFGAIITVQNLEAAADLNNRIAPEHLELAIDNAEALLPKIRHAGSIFLGHHTPEAIGDYVGGSNHVLPTAGTARFASGLGTIDFMKRTAILGCTPDALAQLAPATQTLANCEELQGHARSVSIRLNT